MIVKLTSVLEPASTVSVRSSVAVLIDNVLPLPLAGMPLTERDNVRAGRSRVALKPFANVWFAVAAENLDVDKRVRTVGGRVQFERAGVVDAPDTRRVAARVDARRRSCRCQFPHRS